MGRRVIWKFSVLSTQFCCEHKTALKTGLFKKTNAARKSYHSIIIHSHEKGILNFRQLSN